MLASQVHDVPYCGRRENGQRIEVRFAADNPTLYRMVYFPLSTIMVNDFYRGPPLGLGLEATFRKVDLLKQILRLSKAYTLSASI